jgi:hypothetical protein
VADRQTKKYAAGYSQMGQRQAETGRQVDKQPLARERQVTIDEFMQVFLMFGFSRLNHPILLIQPSRRIDLYNRIQGSTPPYSFMSASVCIDKSASLKGNKK